MLNSLYVKLFGLYFVNFHSNVTTVLELHYTQLLSSKAYFKVCFLSAKILQPIGMSVPIIRYQRT